MTLIDQILSKLRDTSDEDVIVRKLGYHNLPAGKRTLASFRATANIYRWLKSGHYDLKHGSESFLRALMGALDIPSAEGDQEIDDALHRLKKIAAMASPYIFVDTGFRRNSEPIFVLAALEGTRHLHLDKEELVDKSDEEAFSWVGEIVREHYRASDGRLQLWGKIVAYLYHHVDGTKHTYEIDGSRLREGEGLDSGGNKVIESRACFLVAR